MNEFYSAENRLIVAHALYSTTQNSSLGYVKPIGEIIEGKLVQIDMDEFCKSGKVFITKGYSSLEEKYSHNQIFKLTIRLSETDGSCRYVATSDQAEEVKSKDFFQIISCSLPDANNRLVLLEELPITRYVFIEENESVYGPFRWKNQQGEDQIAVELEFIDSPLPNVNLLKYQIYKASTSALQGKAIISGSSPLVKKITQGLEFINNSIIYDYASDKEIVDYCLRLQKDAGISIIEPKQAATMVGILTKNPKANGKANLSRLHKLPSIIESLAKEQSAINEWLGEALSIPSNKDFIVKFIRENEPVFLDALKRERKELIDAELVQIEERIRDQNEKLNSIINARDQAISDLERMKEEAKSEAYLEEAAKQIDGKIEEKRNALNEMESKIENSKPIFDGVIEYETLRRKIEINKDRIKEDERDIEGLKRIKEELRVEIGKDRATLQKTLSDLRPYVDAINGSYYPDETSDAAITVTTQDIPSSTTTLHDQRKFVIDHVQKNLLSESRELSSTEIANLLITMQQSFITVFAGLPGTGKTSLARLLAKSQGIMSRLQEVSVARGWTSQKDLIGYFNPLTSRFQPSNTGVYNFLRALDSESKDDLGRSAMAYILLDEANLSPMEHYWSSFMGMADGDEDFSLRLGNEVLTTPKNLRFLATINYDATTEVLSQRLLNRAPIILLENSDLSIGIKGNEVSSALPVSYDVMEKLFGASGEIPELENGEGEALDAIRSVLQKNNSEYGRPVMLSPRKQKAISHYCNTARALLKPEGENAALDFAVLQHVLPQISGSGNKFRARLKLLSDTLDRFELEKSKAYLDRIISYGDQELNSYEFFCW